MKKSKGFTMIELLATIIILGLLITIAYTSVRNILNRGNNTYYESQENMIVLAGQDYFADYREKLPDEIGDTASVTLETLINESYIDPVKDDDENDCDFPGSRVFVQKITDRDYQYFVTLVCNRYETTEDTADPVITFNPNKKSSTKSITVKMDVTDNEGVASYRYVIEKDGELYQDSGYLNYNGELTIKLTEKGLYEITGYAIDVNGNKSNKKSGKFSIYEGINCAEVDFSSSAKSETWINKNITLTIKLPDNTYRWELSESVNGGSYQVLDNYIGASNKKLTINSDGKHKYKLTVYDSDGNSCIATTEEYYLDKTKPTCESSGGSEEWKNTSITLKGTCKDTGGSGCTGNVTKKFTTNTNKTNQSPGTVYDKAGNSTVCPANQTVKIDKTAPSCDSSGGSSNWTNKDVTIKGTCKDTGGSGCVSNASKTYTSNTNKTNQSPGTVKDNAGNIRTCPANQTVKIDKNPPTCQSSGGSTSWKNTTITLKGTCSDTGGSGCTGNVSKPFTSDTNLTNQSPGTVYDRAGNSTVCPANQTVRVDKTAPSCTSGGGSSNWTNKNVTITGVCSDGGSGCTGNASKTYSSNTNTTTASPGIVKDNAGNIKTCPANQTVKIDKTAPSCSNSGGNSSWTNKNVTIKGTCSDSGGSGCRSNASKTYTSNTNTTTASPGTVYDNAGNSAVCKADRTVKIDKSPPTCTSSGGSTSWKNTTITLTGTCSDSGGSGCRGNVTKQFTSDTSLSNQSPGTVYDNAGNSAVCPANQTVKVDKTAPSCNSAGGKNNWTNQDVRITGYCSDSGSGCTGNASKTYSSNTNTTTASPGTVRDNAGNTRVCPANQTVRIDKRAPSCTSSGGSTSWTNKSITLTGKCSDPGGSGASGCTGNATRTYSTDTNTRNASPGTVYDRAGNSTTCPANQTVRVDKTAPRCTTSGSTGKWTNRSVTLIGYCSDSASGCTSNTITTTVSNNVNSLISPGRVRDKAGNSTLCPSTRVRVDKTAPSCTSSGGSSTWRKTNLTIRGTCSDSGGSGCTGNASKTYSSNTNTTTASPGIVRDAAGNTKTCPANQTVKIDKTAPKCTSSGGSTSWTTGSRTLKGTCSDTGGSGCTGNVTRKFTDETNVTGQSPGTVYDRAGNSTTCPANQTVRIDKTAPTLTASIDNGFLGQAQLRENGKGKTYTGINLTPPTISFSYSDSGSGINTNSVSASCSATDNLGRKYSLSYSYNKANRTIKLNINTANPIVINASCTISVKDNVGKSSSKTISTKIGNGWYKTGTKQICGQPPSYGYKNDCYNDSYWYYYRQGSKVTGWQKIYWYNPSLPEGADRWYYFYTGSEKAINSCYGRPATELATGWCYNVGGYEGWYYLYEPGGKADKTKGIWHSTGAMFDNVTFELYSKTYGWETFTVGPGGKCISGRGC